MPWEDDLEGVQLAIAGDLGSPVHVLAGPGTGKTRAMMRRVARLLEEGVQARDILAVSFTRTAARDLREQLLKLGSPGAESVNATTLHALCFSALHEDAVFQATNRRPRPLLSYEIDQLACDLKKQFGGKRVVNRLIEAYEAAWARLQHEVPGAPKDPRDAEFEAALLDWLRYHRAMLIGELVPILLRFLQANPAAQPLPAYEAVLVDEFQDLNRADQRLVEILAANGNFTVIGDDNQSIYRFRHANPEGLRLFAVQHAGTACHAIEECWRCPSNIVAMSNALIGHDPSARQTPLTARRGRPNATVYVVQHATVENEADALAAYIDQYLAKRPDLPPGQVLVLSPRRIFGNAIRDALILRRRNAMSFFFEDALKPKPAAEGFCLLALLVNQYDRAAYRAWLGLDQADGNMAGYKRLRAHAEAHDLEPFDVCEQISTGQLMLPSTKAVVKRHEQLKARLAPLAELAGIILVDALWDSEDPKTRTIRLAAATVAIDAPQASDLQRQLVEILTQPELPDSAGDVIRIMSLHKSKGLTADLVVVAGCVSGAIPSIDSDLPATEQDAAWKEQRRLFYVAITRAKETLVLSSVTELTLKIARRANIPSSKVYRRNGETYARLSASPFIGELGPSAPAAVKGTDWRTTLRF